MTNCTAARQQLGSSAAKKQSMAQQLKSVASRGHTLRLSYLPFRAMAETARLIFAYGAVPYEDEVVWGRRFATDRMLNKYVTRILRRRLATECILNKYVASPHIHAMRG